MKCIFLPICVAIIFFISWEFIVDVFNVPVFILPAPSKILLTTYDNYDYIAFHTLVTFFEAIIGYILAILLGVTSGIIIRISKKLETAFYPYIIGIKVIPIVAIAPLITIWFGTGIFSKILISSIISYFPVVINTVDGLRNVDSKFIFMMKSFRASKFQLLFKLLLPHALPYIFSALKISITLSIVGAIIGEIIGSNMGIGYVILIAKGQLDTEMIFAAIFASAFLGVTSFYFVYFIEKITIHWK